MHVSKFIFSIEFFYREVCVVMCAVVRTLVSVCVCVWLHVYMRAVVLIDCSIRAIYVPFIFMSEIFHFKKKL